MKSSVTACLIPLLLTLAQPALSEPAAPDTCQHRDLRRLELARSHLAYMVDGPPDGRAIILVGGIDQQLTDWPPHLVEGLVSQGFRVIRYDARDTGCSTEVKDAAPLDWPAIFAAMASGAQPPLPYAAVDLSDDLIGLMDGLRLTTATLVGVSGGSTISALTAERAPDRVDRLILLMASSGNPALPVPADPARFAGVPPAPAAGAPAGEIVAYRIAARLALEGSQSALTPEDIELWATQATRRSYNPDGTARTGAALLALGDLRPRLTRLKSPAVILHGSEDPLIPVAAGREFAGAIDGARFRIVDGMGHALPPAAVTAILEETRTRAAISLPQP